MKILVVEDDDQMGALIERGLQAEGYETARVSNGIDALIAISGDGFSLAEAVKNLVNNAFSYGVEPVSLVVEANDRTAEIAVLDRGAGIPEPGTAGRRFARASANPAGGAGIGLAIVDAVAASHQGRLVLSTPPGGGFRAALRLDLVGAPA